MICMIQLNRRVNQDKEDFLMQETEGAKLNNPKLKNAYLQWQEETIIWKISNLFMWTNLKLITIIRRKKHWKSFSGFLS